MRAGGRPAIRTPAAGFERISPSSSADRRITRIGAIALRTVLEAAPRAARSAMKAATSARVIAASCIGPKRGSNSRSTVRLYPESVRARSDVPCVPSQRVAYSPKVTLLGRDQAPLLRASSSSTSAARVLAALAEGHFSQTSLPRPSRYRAYQLKLPSLRRRRTMLAILQKFSLLYVIQPCRKPPHKVPTRPCDDAQASDRQLHRRIAEPGRAGMRGASGVRPGCRPSAAKHRGGPLAPALSATGPSRVVSRMADAADGAPVSADPVGAAMTWVAAHWGY